MDSIHRVVKAAARRLFLVDVLRTLAVTLTAALSAVIVTRLVERLFGLGWPASVWMWIGIGAGGGAVAASLIWSAARRKRFMGAARELDDRAGLRESLSTALCIEGSKEDPWAGVVIETARQRAASVNVKRAIPVTAPRLWPAPFGAALALMIFWMSMPAVDVLGLLKKKQAVEQQKQQLIEVKADVEAKDKKLQEMLAEAKVDLGPELSDKNDLQTPGDPQKPEEIQRAAVRKLTDLTDRLKELRDSEKSEQLKAMRDAMEKLKQPGEGPLSELSRQMARGNFDKAREELEKLQQKLAEGGMSEQEAAALKEQMQNLAQQMEKIASDQEGLSKQLEQAGLDPKTASELAKNATPEALKKALEGLSNLTPEQREELMKSAMAQKQAMEKMSKMGECMSGMCSGMGKEGMGKEGMQAMEAMQGQLSQMEQMQGEMAALDAALDEANSQLGELGRSLARGEGEGADGQIMGPESTGQWSAGTSRSQANGKGGAGRGQGGNLAAQPADYQTEKKKAPTPNVGGPIIGSRLVYGEQVRGEARQAYESAVEAATQSATEAMENMQIDPELHPAIKSYFGALDQAKAKPAAAAPPPPAGDAKDAGKK